MKLRIPLVRFAGLMLLLGVTALADPTYSIYSNPQLTTDGEMLRYGRSDSGSFAGWYYSSGNYFGFLTTADGNTFGIDPPSAISTHATGVNDSNSVVGYFSDASGIHGFMNAGGTYTTLNAPGAVSTYVYGVNNKGQVVGYYVDKGGVTHGFIESAGHYTTVDIPGALATYGLSINDNGEVVGSFFDGTSVHGFIYHDGTVEYVDYPDAAITWITGINEDGTLIGWSRSCVTCAADPFFKGANGPFSAPFQAGGVGFQPTILNDYWFDSDNGNGPWPTSTKHDPAKIPEPGTATLLGAGALVLVFARRFRKKQ